MTRKQKFRGKEISRTQVVNNLMRYYRLATPEDIEAGKRWYPEANAFCKQLSEEYGVEVYKVAGVVAALSPQTSWSLNCTFARQFIRDRGRGFMGNRDRTIKAKKIYNASHPDQIDGYLSTTQKGAKKTRAFFKNIILPNFCDTVCIDRHMLAASYQRPDETYAIPDSDGKITSNQYDFLSECYVYAAKKVKMVPSAYQALIWNMYRRQRGLEKPVVIDGYVPMEIEDF